MLEREVDHAVRADSRVAQGADVVQAPAHHLGSRGDERLGRGVRAGEPDDLVARVDELGNDGGADPAGRAGHEYTHGRPPGSVDGSGCARHRRSEEPSMSATDITLLLMSVTVIT